MNQPDKTLYSKNGILKKVVTAKKYRKRKIYFNANV